MIQLPSNISPSSEVLTTLKGYQSKIDELSTFEEKSEKAKDYFPKQNKKRNPAFDGVKEALIKMCSGTRRCVYCEDSVGDEVEHIFPKDLYPEKCFHWENYLSINKIELIEMSNEKESKKKQKNQ